jgi:acyl-coenzyme A thioesterase PaaI-like protein
MAVWHKFVKHPEIFKTMMNVWPPFVGAGILVDDVAPDYRHMRIVLKDRVFNRNYVGCHFGGSLFAMTDPFYMLMLIQILGPKYYVWDIGAEIEFLKPAYKTVHADFEVTEEHLHRIREGTAQGQKHEEVFIVSIFNAKGEEVARVTKRLYLRLKPKHRQKDS